MLVDYKQKLAKAIKHLKYSYEKVQNLPMHMAMLDDESLETWESFSARFARVADLFLSKYLRGIVMFKEPGFRGTMRDYINQGEKLGLLDNTEIWIEIRELRNFTAHEYSDKSFDQYIATLLKLSPYLLNILNMIDKL